MLPSTLSDSNSNLFEKCRLQFSMPTSRRRLTNVICTIGKASRNLDTLEKMMRSGLNVVRLNMAHDSQETHRETIQLVRQACENVAQQLGYQRHVAIAMDTKGPIIRTGLIEGNNEIELVKGDLFRLSINRDLIDKGTKDGVFIDYQNVLSVAKPGNRVCLNDGAITLVVKEVAVDSLICQIESGGILGSRKNVKLLGVLTDLPAVSEKDRYDIKFGLDNNIDMVFMSCVRDTRALYEMRQVLGEKGKEVKIVAKIESEAGMRNLDKILKACDGILLDRGDLGVEIPMEKVFLAQKAICARCNKLGKPIILATQMLESMRYKSKPYRSEVADVGNMVLDGVDGLMLSSESAVGAYPAEATHTLNTICKEAEEALHYKHLYEGTLIKSPTGVDAANAVAISAVETAIKAEAAIILVLTISGRSAFLISKFRPRCPIVSLTSCARAARQSHLYRGIIPILYTDPPNLDWLKEIDTRCHYGLLTARKMGLLKLGEAVVIVSAWRDSPGYTNNIRIVYAYFDDEDFDCLVDADAKLTDAVVSSIISVE